MSMLRARRHPVHAMPVLACIALLSACGGDPEPAQNMADAPEDAIENAALVANVAGSTDNAGTVNEAAPESAAPADEPKAEVEKDEPAQETAPAPAAAAASTGDAANGAKLFVQCRVCHSVEPGKNGLGPTLHGIVGSKAAAVEGFNFSPAMKNSGITWTQAALNDYLRAPMKSLPGTKMAFAGIPDDDRRADIIAYLETLK